MNALSYLGRRLLWALVLVVGVTSMSFVVALLLPGDPARMLAGPQASAKDVARVRAIYALDRPAIVEYVHYWGQLVHRVPRAGTDSAADEHKSCAALGPLHLDLGYSFHYRKSVAKLLAEKIPRSLELATGALAVQLVIGLCLGLVAAARRGTRWDDAVMSASLVGISAPTFVSGLALQYLLAYKLRLFPYDGYGSTPLEHFRSLFLPALTLGVFGAAFYARLVRDEVTTLLSADYVRTARAKGASRTRALVVHALRNALVPIATIAALDFGTLVGGAVVTEKLFRWPGVGQLAVDALLNRDGPLVSGTVLFSSTAVVVATLLLDVTYVLLDPRLRRSATRP